jgi:hypothetical protein
MSKIKQMREFIATCPHLNVLADNIHVDWTADKPTNYGIMPTGETIVSRKSNVIGDVTYHKQYNCSIFARFTTANDAMRIENCDFFDDFTEWLEEQDTNGTPPRFSDEEFIHEEYITAQSGFLYEMEKSGDRGTYQIQVQVNYKIIKRRKMN